MYLLSLIYWIITSIRNRLYDFGLLKTMSIEDVRIICVGNITVGGTGKTPAVQYLAKEYIKKGKKVGIVSRGYKGERNEDPFLVRDYEKIYGNSKSCGDEAYLHSLELSIPVMVGKDRYKACKILKERYELDIIILDDGFQHRRLKRDENIVLVDATNPFGGGNLLPKGRLREDIKGLHRATEFIITKSDLVEVSKIDEIKRELAVYGKSIKVSKHGPVFLKNQNSKKNLLEIKGKRVLLFSALANPMQFVKTIEKLEPSVVENIAYSDHYYFSEEDFSYINQKAFEFEADYIISTEKDYVKYAERYERENLFYLKIEFEILESN
jgi:tetraacyldisaccharide 4'-kinase